MDFFYPRYGRNYRNDPFLEEYPPGINIRRLFGDDSDGGNYFDPWRRNQKFVPSTCNCRNCSYNRLRRLNDKNLSSRTRPFTRGQQFLNRDDDVVDDVSSFYDGDQEKRLPIKNVSERRFSLEEDGNDNINGSNNAENRNNDVDAVHQQRDDSFTVQNSLDDINISDDIINKVEETNTPDTTEIMSHSSKEEEETLTTQSPGKQNQFVSEKLKLIESIQKKVNELAEKVKNLSGKVKTKEHLFCEEMLTKCMLELDGVLAEGEEEVRKARKAVISYINENISKLENASQ